MQVGGGTKAHRVRINLSTCWLKSTLPPPTEAPPPPTEAPTFIVVAIYDPRFRQPGLLAWPPRHGGRALHGLYWERWPVEQIPSAGKQMLGSARQFVFASESCQRLPELNLFPNFSSTQKPFSLLLGILGWVLPLASDGRFTGNQSCSSLQQKIKEDSHENQSCSTTRIW